MKIGLDFDGTIASWAGAMDHWLRAHTGRPLDRERNVVEQVTREQLQEMIGAILGSALTLEMEPEEEALDVISRLAGDHELLVVTARHHGEAEFARQWLEQHQVPVREVVSTGRALKAAACRLLDVDVLLDDSTEHLVALSECATVPVLFRSRFVSPGVPPPFVHVVNHWRQFEELCASLPRDSRPDSGTTGNR